MGLIDNLKIEIYTLNNRTSNLRKEKVSLKEMNNILNYKFNITDLNTYILQGISIINDYIYVSAYSEDRSRNSKIFILDSNYKLIHITILDTNSHVGGLAFDQQNNILWVTGKSGKICGYNIKDINTLDNAYAIYKDLKISDKCINIYNHNSIAFLTIYDNKIFWGNYNYNNNSYIYYCNILKNGKLDLENTKEIISTDFIQGIAFKEYHGKKYLFVSSSFGLINKSSLKIYEYNQKLNDLNNMSFIECEMPKMMEQITFNDNNLFTLYEANAKKYHLGLKNNYDVCIYDIEKIFKMKKKKF